MSTPDADARRLLLERLAGLHQQGDYRAALSLAEEHLADDEANADSLEWLGRLRREMGRFSTAEGPLLQALSLRSGAKNGPEYARCLHELALLYDATGRYGNAEPLFRSALDIRRASLGESHPDTATTLLALASLLEAIGRHSESATLRGQALSMRRATLGDSHPDTALALAAEARAACQRGQLGMGEEMARRALATLEAARGPTHPDRGDAAQLLSRILVYTARLPEAEGLALAASEACRNGLGERHYRTASALEGLALLRGAQGQSEEAERLARQSVSITRAALGQRHAGLGDALTALGNALQSRNDHAEAEKAYRQALEVFRAALGESHERIALCLHDIGGACAGREDLAGAEEQFRAALALLDTLAEAGPVPRLAALEGLARVLLPQGRLDEAEQSAREAVARAREIPDSPASVANCLDALARCVQSQGRLDEAAIIWGEVLEWRERAAGSGHPHYADALRSLAEVQQLQGDMAGAAAGLERAADALRQSLGPKHPEYAQALCALADVRAAGGHVQQAEELYQEAAEIERERVGEGHPDHTHVVQSLARLYLQMGNVPAAEVRFRQALQYARRAHGDEHPEYARAVHDLAVLYHQVGDLAAAAGFYQMAADIRREASGEDSPDFAESVLGQAQVLQMMGRLDEAEPLFEEAAKAHSAGGENSPAAMRTLHLTALFRQARGDYRAAREGLERVASRFEAMLGSKSPMLVQVLSDLARLHAGTGDHLAAEQYFRRAMEINREAFPDEGMPHAQDLINVALALRSLGELEEAETLVRHSLDILRAVRGPEHQDTAAGLGLLAGIVQARGRLEEAEVLYQQVLEMTRAIAGQGHPAVASVLADLAGHAAIRGKFDESAALYKNASDLVKSSLGEDHGDHVNLLRAQAGVLQVLGRVEEAESLLRQRMTILRRLLGPSTPALAPALQALADLLKGMGRFDEAEQAMRQAAELLERAMKEAAEETGTEPAEGPEPIRVPMPPLALAKAKNDLAESLLALGRHGEAEPLLREALEEGREASGGDHPAICRARFNLSLVLALSGRMREAMDGLERLLDKDARLWAAYVSMVPEQARAMACQGLHEDNETYLTLAVRQGVEGEAAARVYARALRRKRTGVEVLGRPAWPGWGERHPGWREELRRFSLLDRQIAGRRWAGPGMEGAEAHDELLAGWVSERDGLEEQLGEHVPEVALRRRLWNVSLETLAPQIPPGWATVEFIHFREFDPVGVHRRPPASVMPGHYLLAVWRPEKGPPRLFDLGRGDAFEPMVMRWRAELESGVSSVDAAGLRAAVVDRIWPHVSDCKGLILSPDGELLHAPLDALPCDGGTLLERFEIRTLLCLRDLLREGRTQRERSRPLVAGPSPIATGLWQSIRALFGSGADEVHEVRRSLGGAAAVVGREGILSARSPEFLHFASPWRFQVTEPRLGHWENPMAQAWSELPGGEKISALEISGMDLWSTRCVFLPGMDTPARVPNSWPRLGGVWAGFVVAGAASVASSLWPSPARADVVRMYHTRLAAGLPPSVALRQVRLDVKRRHPSPAGWAGWVCYGD